MRSWRTGWRPRDEVVPRCQRLAIIFRLRECSPRTEPLGTRAVCLKLFKDIPEGDIETLLPGANVCIGLVDQARIALPTVTGLGLTLLKLLKAGYLHAE